MLQRPGSSLQSGVRCHAQGHLSRGIDGGESAPPPTIPAGRDSNSQPLDSESKSLTIWPRLPPNISLINKNIQYYVLIVFMMYVKIKVAYE